MVRGRGLMLVAGMRAGERKGEAQAMQAQQQQQAAAKQAAASPPPTATKDPIAELQKLSDLHKSGALTDEEFAAAKQKIIS